MRCCPQCPSDLGRVLTDRNVELLLRVRHVRDAARREVEPLIHQDLLQVGVYEKTAMEVVQVDMEAQNLREQAARVL